VEEADVSKRKKKRRKKKRWVRPHSDHPENVVMIGDPPVGGSGISRSKMDRFMKAMDDAGYGGDAAVEWIFQREPNGAITTQPRDQRVVDILVASLGVDRFDVDTSKMQLTNAEDDTRIDWEALKTPKYKPGEHAVLNYLLVCQKLLEGANDPTATRDLENGMGESGAAVQLARRAWAASRNARVFEFKADLRESMLDDEAGRLMQGVHRFDSDGQEPSEDAQRWFERQCEDFAYPDPRPFEFCFFGFDRDIYLARDYWHTRLAIPDFDSVLRCAVVGYLISPTAIWEMLYVYLGKPISLSSSIAVGNKKLATVSDEFLVPNVVYDNGAWRNPRSLNPFFVTALNEHVLTHQTTVKEHRPGLNQRFRFRKVRKNTVNSRGLIPRPYYVVPVKDRVIDERERRHETGTGRELTYRHDREGHWRTYVRRGPLPLSQKERDKWLGRGYELHTVTGPKNLDVLQDMLKKGHAPKGRDEWLAVKRTWIDDQVVGDESLPYVPAVRVPEEDL
jgi:hypothetical protein